ncbi:MAG TPA: fibronectin type III domain-containing protein, partial [Candidatus Saccharibacteria bacterium]|nr:fibronectin type III domain-containing protein [Candidatus Saccharibacteria bacterium]
MYRRSAGITIVELLTVIVVVGILATIATIGFGTYQANTRDVQRAASATAISEALEKYFEDNGEYPGCSKIEADGLSVVTDTLKGLDQQALLIPSADPSISNYIKCGDSELSVEGDDYFEYVGDDTSTCQEGPACLTYTLRYKSEVDGAVDSISARHDVSLGSSGTTHVSLNSVSFTEIAITWVDVPSTLHYIVERATNSSFTSGRVSTTTENTSFTATGLTQGTSYYFRVRAVSPLGNSAWSNVRTATTLALNTPSISIPSESVTASSFDVTWGPIANATSYRLQHSTASNFSSPTTISDITTSPYSMVDLETGTRYYVRVQAVAG